MASSRHHKPVLLGWGRATDVASGIISHCLLTCAFNEVLPRYHDREGNGWSYAYCRRQWSLVDAEHLRYRFLNAWDAALQALDDEYHFLSAQHQIVSFAGDSEQAGKPSCCAPTL